MRVQLLTLIASGAFPFIFFWALLIAEAASAETLYEVRKSRGVVTFTTRKPSSGSYRVVNRRAPRHSRMIVRRGARERPRKSEYDLLIKQTALSHGMDAALVKAVVHIESSFRPHVTSPKGAMGLMQLMPATAKRWGVDDAYNPEQNVRGGTKHLQMLMQRYHGNLRLVLAAYNAGEKAVDRYRGVPPYRETQNYVRKGLRMLEVYRKKFS